MRPDRRHAPRVDTEGRVRGRITTLDTPVHIREISLGGLSLESAVEFSVGAVHQFELVLGDGATVEVSAEARYCRPAATEVDGRYVTGFQFVDAADAGRTSVTDLVDGLS